MTRTTPFLTAAAFLGLTLSAAGASAIAARDYSRTLVMHQDEMRACAGDARGEVTIELTISPRGALTGGRVTESASRATRAMGECVLREARGWTFASSTSGGGGAYLLTATDESVQVRRAPRARR